MEEAFSWRSLLWTVEVAEETSKVTGVDEGEEEVDGELIKTSGGAAFSLPRRRLNQSGSRGAVARPLLAHRFVYSSLFPFYLSLQKGLFMLYKLKENVISCK